MCLKLLLFCRKLEFDGVEETNYKTLAEPAETKNYITMDCEESADAISEIRPLGRHPFNRQAR